MPIFKANMMVRASVYVHAPDEGKAREVLESLRGRVVDGGIDDLFGYDPVDDLRNHTLAENCEWMVADAMMILKDQELQDFKCAQEPDDSSEHGEDDDEDENVDEQDLCTCDDCVRYRAKVNPEPPITSAEGLIARLDREI